MNKVLGDSIIDSNSKNTDSKEHSIEPISFDQTPCDSPLAHTRDLPPAEAILRKLELSTGKRIHSQFYNKL